MIEELLTPYISERYKTDPKYREGHIRIINPLLGTEVLGLHMAEVKAVAKELAGADYDWLTRFRDNAPSLCQEEMLVWGLMINKLKLNLEDRLKALDDFIPHIQNWAVCDSVVCDSKWAAKLKKTPDAKDSLWDFLAQYFRSDKEFEVRYAIVMSMCYFTDTHLDAVFEQISSLDYDRIVSVFPKVPAKRPELKVENSIVISGTGYALGEPPYYVRMAVSWLLATTLAKYPDRTRAFVNAADLPDSVVRLYVRKAKESFRTKDVSPF